MMSNGKHGLDFIKKVVKSSSASSETKSKVTSSIDNKQRQSTPSSKPKKDYEKKIDQELGLSQLQKTKEGPQPVYVPKSKSNKSVIKKEGKSIVVQGISPVDYRSRLAEQHGELGDIAKQKNLLYEQGISIDDEKIREMQSNILDEQIRSFDWHPDTRIRTVRNKKGDKTYQVDFPFTGAEHYYSTKKKVKEEGFLGYLGTAFTPSDFLGLKSAYYMATGQKDKAWETKVSAVEDTKRPFHEFYLSSPMGVIGISTVTAFGVGSGVGSLSAISSTAGKATSYALGVGFTAKTAMDVAPVVKNAFYSGDYGNLLNTGSSLGLSVASGVSGFKSGYNIGYGRTSAFLYARSTYSPGSAEYIRFKNTLKTARNLQYVKSKNIEPLDFTKDIMRLDSKTAESVISYLQKNPKSVIGGSGSQYAQTSKNLWYKYRNIKPRDIDLLVKDVKSGKAYIKAATHEVDIHGFDFGGKSGRSLSFGFESQRSIKIGKYKYMRLGEQLSRKGISSVMKETQYRWFKDVPDFKMVSEQLISSASSSKNPLNWFRASSASKSFKYVLNPKSSPSFGKSSNIFSNAASSFAKKFYNPKSFFKPSSSSYGYYSSMSYPSYGYVGYNSPSYVSLVKDLSYTPSISKSISYKPVISSSFYKPSNIIHNVSISNTTKNYDKVTKPDKSFPKYNKNIKDYDKVTKPDKYYPRPNKNIKDYIPYSYPPNLPDPLRSYKYPKDEKKYSSFVVKPKNILPFNKDKKKKKDHKKYIPKFLDYGYREFKISDLKNIGRRFGF